MSLLLLWNLFWGAQRGWDFTKSVSTARPGVDGFCSLCFRKATKKLIFLVWCTKSSSVFFFFFCLTFYLLSEGVWYTLFMVDFPAESLPYNKYNSILIRKRLILSLNHQNEDWQMIPYLSTNLLCDLQQTPQVCAAVPRVSGGIVLCFGGAGCSSSWHVPEADPTTPPCQQCSAS